ncbi:O-antigen polymerase [Clavibacter sp. km1a]|uniref:O-antigen polymerase n=1 Tax=Clavibacter sp. km1a TaxID=3459136 RepID=UPI004041ABE1
MNVARRSPAIPPRVGTSELVTTPAAPTGGLAYGLISTLLTLTLCGVVPLGVFATVPYDTSGAVPLELGMSLVSLILSGARLSFVIGAGRQSLFTFAFWLFAYVFVTLPTFAQILTRRFPGTTPDIRLEYVPAALAIVIVGLVCAMFGGGLVGRLRGTRPEAHVALAPESNARRWTLDRTRITLLATVGFVGWAYYVSRIGFATFLSSREEMGAARSLAFPDPSTATIISSAATLPLLVCVHAMALYRRSERSTTGTARSFTLMLPAALLAVVFAINIFSSSRYLFGTMAFSLLVLAGGFKTRTRARLSMSSLVFLLLAAFPLFAIFRRETTSTSSELGASAFVNSGDYDSFAQIVNSVNYAASEGFVWGKQLLGPFVFWVPRTLWPDKPIDTGVLIAQFRGYNFENLSAPFWAEAFMSGGWGGVVILFLILGYVLKSADGSVHRSLESAGVASITAAILSFYMLILLRGSLLQATSTLAVILISLLIVASRRRTAPDGPPDPTGREQIIATRVGHRAPRRRSYGSR